MCCQEVQTSPGRKTTWRGPSWGPCHQPASITRWWVKATVSCLNSCLPAEALIRWSRDESIPFACLGPWPTESMSTTEGLFLASEFCSGLFSATEAGTGVLEITSLRRFFPHSVQGFLKGIWRAAMASNKRLSLIPFWLFIVTFQGQVLGHNPQLSSLTVETANWCWGIPASVASALLLNRPAFPSGNTDFALEHLEFPKSGDHQHSTCCVNGTWVCLSRS